MHDSHKINHFNFTRRKYFCAITSLFVESEMSKDNLLTCDYMLNISFVISDLPGELYRIHL
jgi:hypothetical protein